MGYYFFMDGVLLPVAPAKLTTSIRNQNKTISLINDSEVNILKDAGLTELSFECLLPNSRYPFALYDNGFQKAKYFLDVFERLKVEKKPFQFVVSRSTPNGEMLFNTNIKVSLEDYKIVESAKDSSLDVKVSIELKQYRSYGVKTVTVKQTNKVASTTTSRDSKKAGGTTYTVKSGDTLWNIAKKMYGSGSDYKKIYDANKTVIENAAKKHGKSSSSNGHWIYAGTKLTIPAK